MAMGMTVEQLLDFNGKVIAEFRANGGKCGGPFEGNPMLLLTMTGARTGRRLTTPLTYHADADRFVVMASAGGSPTHPAWYHNLKAEPAVEVEVGSERFPARAVELSGGDRDRVVAGMVAAMPRFGEYLAQAGRTIPVFALERC